MNIFVLDLAPNIAAHYHADKHVVKMILETAQLLSTAVKIHYPQALNLYGITHKNHPCAKWARETRKNFEWLSLLGIELCQEYNFRYGKVHKSQDIIVRAYSNFLQLFPDKKITPFAQAMPVQYQIPNDPVQAYRNYYRGAKKHMLTYKRREPPNWIKDIATHVPL